MALLKAVDSKLFQAEIPYKPMGKYAHFLTIRITESYPLFQTDGELNKARVRAGVKDKTTISRLSMFKRKQSTPERLVGRELLRNYGFMTDKECEYNVAFAMDNPDCIIYGFAIGDSGSEKSKVVVDTAFSITPFDESHETFTLNAPYENGTMAAKGEKKSDGKLDGEIGAVTARINQQDHVKPQVFFPSIVTLKDPTEASFLYVFNNILRTRHYGAQTTRTGRVRNELIGVVFADGEITSNLRWTQGIYDKMQSNKTINSPEPLDEDDVISAAKSAIESLMADEFIVHTDFIGDAFKPLLNEVKVLTGSETGIKSILQKADAEAKEYAKKHITKKKTAAKAG
ncbi:CRISPR-associated protein Csc2 [Nostoc linckia z18]|uniref:CRISPR-associated protein Csc2 n=2 Tax=Nostoc linckia TaxID=92942 RepID=A0A9Q6EMY3_NOSLI|nr:type I-D CRISPR-associated protein Cas7/Csc2 [Nostoc linckia]PHK42430.1 CRISPR-associated protein Csc2 [Nostoc linckia z15]PHK45780.1 CRISPR-associated protein Csc2 [Nostoc linckia z16]PHJ64149.1 CRISPR-associated protein Csc2 [Nostoc linckia z1]PHJ69783.1 CRISPR-associated protein Csc2 [Nostoc linckia z3]PHJ75900.1 CRISPR-associated protein Csc2 [Nostoc linckia z2]